uniref:Uncharacterized protein n=1 Tax=Tanacetum cinerariifolium TaxID=118510 RepID=A0A699IS00_TANCI|nr:hypothetical protein [Tanacetum cinerariifolium]
MHTEELVIEPTEEVIIDASNDDVVNDVDQPQNDISPKHNWFTQPPRPPTLDPEWNKGKAVDDSQEHTWFNELVELIDNYTSSKKVTSHLNDIEDMLFLVVQHKLFQLDGSDIVDLVVALCMFTRSLIIQRRVEDVQLGVESYQKKINNTKPQKDFPRISIKELYMPSFDPPGVVYEDLNKKKRVIRADELYKFSDGTLKLVHDELHHRILNFRLGYNKKISRRKMVSYRQEEVRAHG